MTLSEVCKKYHFTRRVIQGYEKEGLVKHTGRNKYGYLMYDENQIRKIAYIRYLQLNGITLKTISLLTDARENCLISTEILKQSNIKHKKEIDRINKLINKNNHILEICKQVKNDKEKEREVYELIMEELTNDETN